MIPLICYTSYLVVVTVVSVTFVPSLTVVVVEVLKEAQSFTVKACNNKSFIQSFNIFERLYLLLGCVLTVDLVVVVLLGREEKIALKKGL